MSRKVSRDGIAPGCPVHRGQDDVWRVQDFAGAREVLRHPDTKQAGFLAEQAGSGRHHRPPVLYRDGKEHVEHRRQTAKYFTPKRVDSAYRAMMERFADEQVAALRRRGEADLADLGFQLAVDVVGDVLGLTEASPRMARRLGNFFREGDGWLHKLRGTLNIVGFMRKDVKPSIAARRAERRDDLISHLIDEGCTDADILGECVTFGAAGMITTREFIVAAAWHLFTDETLRKRFMTGDEPERKAILHEILRLDPVIGSVVRRTTAPVTVGGETIPAGALVDVGIAAINVDPATVGEDAERVCPARPLGDGVQGAILSFGDGPHRCPGSYIAIQETDIFLSRLFALPGLRMTGSPQVRHLPDFQSYELRGLRISVQ
jgi:cytochrome P450